MHRLNPITVNSVLPFVEKIFSASFQENIEKISLKYNLPYNLSILTESINSVIPPLVLEAVGNKKNDKLLTIELIKSFGTPEQFVDDWESKIKFFYFILVLHEITNTKFSF